MFKILSFCLLISQFAFSQQAIATTTYINGHNGMELIVTSKSNTIVISTFNSKMELKDDIAEKLYAIFKETKFKTGDEICVAGNDAKVTGKCFVTRKGDLTAVNFYYDKIEWSSGLVEFHKDRL